MDGETSKSVWSKNMNPSNKNNKQELFEKYVQGQISKDEMHLLNRMALDDDFLFEALEGFSDFETTMPDAIADLNKRLKSEKKSKKPIWLYWTGAAASILILLFAVNYLNTNYLKSTEKQLASEVLQVESSDREIMPIEQIPTEVDETKIKDDFVYEPVSEPGSESKPTTPQKALNKNQASEEKVEVASQGYAEEEAEKNEEVLEEIVIQKPLTPEHSVAKKEIQNDIAFDRPINGGLESERSGLKMRSLAAPIPAKPQKKMGGIVTDTEGDPLPGSNIFIGNTRQFLTTDIDGYFNGSFSGEINDVTIHSLGYEDQVIKLKEGMNNVIRMKPIENYTPDVVFMYEPALPDTDTTEIADFENFTRRNLRIPPELIENAIEGYVTLEINMSKNGTVEQINVVDSLGFGTEEEAERLVRSYKWDKSQRGSKSRRIFRFFFKRN